MTKTLISDVRSQLAVSLEKDFSLQSENLKGADVLVLIKEYIAIVKTKTSSHAISAETLDSLKQAWLSAQLDAFKGTPNYIKH